MHEVVERAKDSANVEEEVRLKNINILARHLQNALRFKRRMERKKVRFLMLFVSAAVTFVSWFFLLLCPCFSRWFIEQHLELSSLDHYGTEATQSATNVHKFVYEYLRRDGVFVLRMVSAHAGIIFGTDLILELWKTFYGIEKTAITPLTPNGDDPLQNELKSATAIRNRKKSSNLMAILEAGDIQTALMPITPENDEKRGNDSDDDGKR
ncbi:unnamed protein product [Nippostrongylus brasiliensis]|uniref:Innexin n=1 Tax=Nippostrongylus brasiliensis TaxID=27835 RepID=A0A0N4YIS3_NIPBR|nr:unnamed protein product [Nippostrongylus brasiliensis]